MPELPEVETIRRDLEAVLLGKRVEGLEVFDPRLATRAQAARWTAALLGQTCTSTGRHGKYLWLTFSNDCRLLIHLRMTGELVLDDHPGIGLRRLSLTFSQGRQLSLYDQRRFAEVRLLAPDDERLSRAPLGPDAMNGLDPEALFRNIRGRTATIHALLLNQSLLAGVGNIYSQEALFKARIRPTRRGLRVTRREWRSVLSHLRQTLEEALTLRGSTSRNYRDASGLGGQAQTRHLVYQKSGKPCVCCGTVLKSVKVAGRGCVYCPQCQS